MVDAGYRFLPMTLEASDPSPDGMTINALLRVAILTLLQFEYLNPIM